MVELPSNEYIEARGGGYFIRGSRVSVASVAYEVLRGQTVEEIHASFPILESRQKLEEVVAYVNAHLLEIKAYLADREKRWEEARKSNPPHFVERMRRRREELKSA